MGAIRVQNNISTVITELHEPDIETLFQWYQFKLEIFEIIFQDDQTTKKTTTTNLHLNENKAGTEALQSPRHWCIKDTKQLYVQFPVS